MSAEGFKFVIPEFKLGDTIVGPRMWGTGKVVAIFTNDQTYRRVVEYIIQPEGDIPAYKLIQTLTAATMEDAKR